IPEVVVSRMDCFRNDGEESPKELLFIHRFSYGILHTDSRIHSTTFATAYGSRSIEWYFDVCSDRRSPQIRLAQRRRRSDEAFPVGNCKFAYKAVSRNYETVAENETKEALFNGFYVVADSNEFFLALFRILEEPNFEGGQINFIIQLSFTPDHFFHCTIRAEIAPPTYLLSNDFREISLAKIVSTQRDFKIMVKDGEIQTSKYLIFVTMNYFHEFLSANPFASFIRLNFQKEIVKAVLDFALKGIFNISAEEIDKIGEFLRCVRFIRPIGYESITKYIGNILTDRVMKDWRKVHLNEAARMFDIAYEHGFVSLLDGSMNLIADQYYSDFRLNYNESSEGDEGAIFRRLNHSDIADFLSPINVLSESFRKHSTSLRILKFMDKISNPREIIA
uniref:BTB domain-containing protein n=1 Tax=Parascaris univalens TaxID=6257 RepID=A0A915B340_PARUN